MRTHTKTFHIRFTEKEYDRLCRYAAKAGLPKTTYIRHMINGCRPRENPPMEYFDFMRALFSLGNKLDALTRRAHWFGSIHATMLEDSRKRLSELILTITNRMMLPEKVDVPATLERGRQLAEAELNKRGKFHAEK